MHCTGQTTSDTKVLAVVRTMNVQVKEVAVDVKAVMDTWTRQSGFPIVHVSVIGRYVKLRQERFLFDRRADKTQPPSDYK